MTRGRTWDARERTVALLIFDEAIHIQEREGAEVSVSYAGSGRSATRVLRRDMRWYQRHHVDPVEGGGGKKLPTASSASILERLLVKEIYETQEWGQSSSTPPLGEDSILLSRKDGGLERTIRVARMIIQRMTDRSSRAMSFGVHPCTML